jgi:hypothetical protein
MDRTVGERLAVIEEIVLRIETKQDEHIASISERVSTLEKAWAATKAVVSVFFATALAAIGAYFKSHK